MKDDFCADISFARVNTFGGKNMENKTILIMDFGGQYSQLIARRVRESNVYCEVVPYTYSIEKIREKKPAGIILSGGPTSVYADKSPSCDSEVFKLGVPVLGICYGGQLMAHTFGGKVTNAVESEYGKRVLLSEKGEGLFKNVPKDSLCWMSHNDHIVEMPEGFTLTSKTETCPIASMESIEKKLYALQFHPEVEHTEYGREIIGNFLFEICGLDRSWTMDNFAKNMIEDIRSEIGEGKALCALSGGVDSSVAAVLVSKAIGKNLTCIFVDHGLLRKDEGDQVEKVFKEKFDINFIRVNAQKRFLDKLRGITEPERKRKIIGEEFIRVFEEEKTKLGAFDYLVQGTIYPDVIESGTDTAEVIKSHHNVGGLPEDVDFKLIEPLKELFKDEVRKVGREIGVPEEVVSRQPFPGPGLGIRVVGEVTEEKLEIVREADFIFRDEIAKAGLDKEIWQYFAALPNVKSVGVMGDERTYNHAIALRAVLSVDGMTSDWARIPFEVMDRISNRIVNNVKGINRVFYDVTSKPPSTIELE